MSGALRGEATGDHERGQRKGPLATCDHVECDSTDFDLVDDRLTDETLVVCSECGFTMGCLG